MKLLKNNYFWFAVVVLLLILFIYGYGFNQLKQGYNDAKLETATATISDKIEVDEDSVASLKLKIRYLNDSIKLKDERRNNELKQHQRYQFNATSQRNYYVSYIERLNDSIKNFKIDSSANNNSSKTLVAIYNYPILLKQYDVCQTDIKIKDSTLSDRTLQLSNCKTLNNYYDTLSSDLKTKVNILEKQIPKKHPILKAIKNIGLSIGSVFATFGGWELWQKVK